MSQHDHRNSAAVPGENRRARHPSRFVTQPKPFPRKWFGQEWQAHLWLPFVAAFVVVLVLGINRFWEKGFGNSRSAPAQPNNTGELAELNERARAALTAKNYPEAARLLEELVLADPHNAKALDSLARIYQNPADPRLYNPRFASHLAKKLVQLAAPESKEQLDALFLLAECQLDANDWDAAIATMQRIDALLQRRPQPNRTGP